jgi:hypothetical protein
MWLANFEDGSTVSSKAMNWTDLPTDKRITGIQLVHPGIRNLYLNLSEDYDQFFFLKEAAAVALQPGQVVAEIAGGINLELRIATEVRMESLTGNVFVHTYKLSEFRYAQQILRSGKRQNHKPLLQKSVAV